jgi:hypothetical protein
MNIDPEFNARMAANCLAGGYLRVQPRHGDTDHGAGKRYIAAALRSTRRSTRALTVGC